MKYLTVAALAAGLLSGAPCFAQSTTQNNGTVSSTAAQATSNVGNAAKNASNSAAINGNPAIATSSSGAMTPASGSNSFTMGEARARMERDGYSNVSSLTKDDNGVWRGQAKKDGSTANVWMDYKGNIGQGK